MRVLVVFAHPLARAMEPHCAMTVEGNHAVDLCDLYRRGSRVPVAGLDN
jgi:hypothetical protein